MMRYILYASVATLAVVSLYMAQSGYVQDWEKCKESLFTQVITGECTLRPGYEQRTITINEKGEEV